MLKIIYIYIHVCVLRSFNIHHQARSSQMKRLQIIQMATGIAVWRGRIVMLESSGRSWAIAGALPMPKLDTLDASSLALWCPSGLICRDFLHFFIIFLHSSTFPKGVCNCLDSRVQQSEIIWNLASISYFLSWSSWVEPLKKISSIRGPARGSGMKEPKLKSSQDETWWHQEHPHSACQCTARTQENHKTSAVQQI